MGRGLHGLLGVRLSSHHAHLHRVLGRLVHVSVVTVVAAVHGRVAHTVAVERGHVHRVVGGRGGHQAHPRHGAGRVHLRLVRVQRLGTGRRVVFRGHLRLDPLRLEAHVALEHHVGWG